MRKVLISLLLVLLTVCLFVSCSSSPKSLKVTLHVPDRDLTKASEWQNKKMYIIYADEDINEFTSETGIGVHSFSTDSEVTVEYEEGDTIYDVITNRIFVYEPVRNDSEEDGPYNLVPIFVYMIRYGIGDLYISTTGFDKDDCFVDWNQPVTSEHLYLCFDPDNLK